MAVSLDKRSHRSRESGERYYLLPGMGGRARRQKVRQMIWWGILGGFLASVVVGAALYLMNRLSEGSP